MDIKETREEARRKHLAELAAKKAAALQAAQHLPVEVRENIMHATDLPFRPPPKQLFKD